MRIGQFAAQNNTSIDTIRHYMSLGLLVPEKHNAQFDFDENCTDDFQEIVELKKIGFSLSEIQQLMLYRRIGKLTEYDRRMTYTTFFEKKKALIDTEIEKLHEMKRNLNKELEVLQVKHDVDKDSNNETIGIALSSLELFACPFCHGSFEIIEGSIQHGILNDATLACSCDYQIRIADGIVFTPEIIGKYEKVKSTDLSQYSEHYIDEYINTTHIDYLKKLYAGLQWATRHIESVPLDNAIALELGSGHGYYMRHMLDRFSDSSTYIAVDHDPVKIMWLKKIIERSHPKCKVIFICADFKQMPLRSGSVDTLLDVSGSSNYSFEHPEFLLYEINHLLKNNARILGFYILFENFVSQSKVPVSLRKGFQIQHIKSHLKDLQFICIDDYLSEPVDKGGPLEDYFVDGERVRTYLYSGVKSIKPLG
ncbi:MAG: MerR family transcriptional regulator [Dethiosulfatibacter sp.]|nr:MerR family transcriptional regulator [Dethiosulfatibacter sp.]